MKPFPLIERERLIAEDELFMVIWDKYPISQGHTLIIVKTPKERFLELTMEERDSLMGWTDWTIRHLGTVLTPKPDGFNLGLNDGAAAGQTIGQLHLHVIPRYNGDCLDPRGGIRNIVPQKARYWE